jgi:hypothetical protein
MFTFYFQTHQFDKVVRDYQKVAKVKEANVPLVNRVVQSIQKIVDDFRSGLKAQLDDHDIPVEEQEGVIQ